MFRFAAFLLILAAFCTQPVAVYAQDQDENNDASNAARLEVKMTELQEEIRRLQGSIEQMTFQNRELKAQLDKTTGDLQYRIDALEKKQAAVPASPVAVQPVPEAVQPPSDQLRPVEPVGNNAIPEDGSAKPAAAAAAMPKFASPRDQYNYAFKLLNQAKYAEAGAAFSAFAHEHPKDPLIGNAYYWLGETYYVRRDYVRSADNFRLGYEAIPTGPKAADNLLKLAMSLNAMNKDKEACVVLKQVTARFTSTASSVKSRAEQEINRIGCN